MVGPNHAIDVWRMLHPGLQKWIQNQGWKDLTQVQKEAIPVILEGRNCVIEAPTAGGKTEAALFPALSRIVTGAQESVKILYLAPLRALLNDIEVRAERYANACGYHSFKWHGDVGQFKKVQALTTPPDLLLTTPESLEAILLRKAGWREFFKGLRVIIIDEAHNFAFGDRGGHLLSLLARVCRAVEEPPQRIALTATVANTKEMLEWISGGDNRSGSEIRIFKADQRKEYEIHYLSPPEDEISNGSYAPAAAPLVQMLQKRLSSKRSLVFVNSRRNSESLAKPFAEERRLGSPLSVKLRTHHSAVSRFFREEAERLIKEASESGINAIISTSTLELGIDIGELDHVIQIGALASPSAFLQRVGRTGRRPGRPQSFLGLCNLEEDLLLLTATVNQGLRGETEAIHYPGRAFHLLAHQVICLALQEFGIEESKAWETLSRANCFSKINTQEFHFLVDHMVKEEYLRRDGNVLLTGEKTEVRFLHSGWRRLFAVFDTAPLYEVYDGKNQVGTLDAAFVETLEVPFHFLLAGKLWKAVGVNPKQHVLKAIRSSDAMAPKWSGFGGPDVPYETAQEAGRLVFGTEVPSFLNAEAKSMLSAIRSGNSEIGWRQDSIVILDGEPTKLRIVTYAGDRINRTLSKLISAKGIGTATSSYQDVTVQRKGKHDTSLSDEVRLMIDQYSKGNDIEPGVIEKDISPQLRPFPFSPFAQCLPESLWISSFCEQRLDCPGLRRMLREKSLREAD